jgi:hypothetical protein
MSRLNPQGHCRVLISIVEQRCQATKKRKPCGGSKFKVQEFKVNFYVAALKPKLSLSRKRSLFQWLQPVPNVPPLRSVQVVPDGLHVKT